MCKTKLGNTKKPRRDCRCEKCGPEKLRQPLGVFAHPSIQVQLLQILQRPNMLTSLQYRDTRVKLQENNIEDIYDGAAYRELEQNFLANRNNFSLTLWMDGVSVAKSSKATAVAILLILNELSPHARKKHMILGGVCVTSTGKPISNDILKSFVRELASLQVEGLTWTPHEGGP